MQHQQDGLGSTAGMAGFGIIGIALNVVISGGINSLVSKKVDRIPDLTWKEGMMLSAVPVLVVAGVGAGLALVRRGLSGVGPLGSYLGPADMGPPQTNWNPSRSPFVPVDHAFQTQPVQAQYPQQLAQPLAPQMQQGPVAPL